MDCGNGECDTSQKLELTAKVLGDVRQPGLEHKNLQKIQIEMQDDSISYATFYEKFLIGNYPCLLNTNFTNDWESRKHWIKSPEKINEVEEIKENSEEAINFDFLQENYGHEKIQVTNCNKILESDECCTTEMTVNEYIEYWKAYKSSKYPFTMQCLYLKDWHILKSTSTPQQAGPFPYEIPIYFKSDWLNEYCYSLNLDDFCFSYMGPKGSWTGFHSDVYSSFSWSANIIGRKKWRIYFPNRVKELYEITSPGSDKTRIQYDYQRPGVEGMDYIEIIQEAGQIIFIPSGWFHIVWNLEDTISINHNWFNGSNLELIWTSLYSALNDVEIELTDLRNDAEYSTCCQSLLKANHGMNYDEFLNILLFIWKSRIHHQCNNFNSHHKSPTLSATTTVTSSSSSDSVPLISKSHFSTSTSFGPIHCQYDLKCIQSVIKSMSKDIKEREESHQIQFHTSILDKLLEFNLEVDLKIE